MKLIPASRIALIGRAEEIQLFPSFNSPVSSSSSWVKGNAILKSFLCWRHFSPWMQGAEKTAPQKSQRKSKCSLSVVSPLRISPILGLTRGVPREQMENESSSIRSSISNATQGCQKQSIYLLTLQQWETAWTQYPRPVPFLLILCCSYTGICHWHIYTWPWAHMPPVVPNVILPLMPVCIKIVCLFKKDICCFPVYLIFLGELSYLDNEIIKYTRVLSQGFPTCIWNRKIQTASTRQALETQT